MLTRFFFKPPTNPSLFLSLLSPLHLFSSSSFSFFLVLFNFQAQSALPNPHSSFRTHIHTSSSLFLSPVRLFFLPSHLFFFISSCSLPSSFPFKRYALFLAGF
eukprot:UN00544